MNRKDIEQAARGLEKLQRLQAEGKLPKGDIQTAARAYNLQQRQAAARAELLNFWTTMSPADRQWIAGLPPHMQEQYALAVGLSADARGVAAATLQQVGGRFDALAQELDRHVAHDVQQATHGEVDARISEGAERYGNTSDAKAREADAALLAETLGIKPAKGQTYGEAVSKYISEVSEGTRKDPRLSAHPEFQRAAGMVEREQVRERIGARRETDKPQLEEKPSPHTLAQRARRAALDAEAKRIEAEPTRATKPGKALQAAREEKPERRFTEGAADLTRRAAMEDFWDSNVGDENASIVSGADTFTENTDSSEVAQ